jgi:hypothetical protein
MVKVAVAALAGEAVTVMAAATVPATASAVRSFNRI